jgi:hypothetical protein
MATICAINNHVPFALLDGLHHLASASGPDGPFTKCKRPARDWPCKPFHMDCWLKTSSVPLCKANARMGLKFLRRGARPFLRSVESCRH